MIQEPFSRAGLHHALCGRITTTGVRVPAATRGPAPRSGEYPTAHCRLVLGLGFLGMRVNHPTQPNPTLVSRIHPRNSRATGSPG